MPESRYQLVVVGSSWGGMHALQRLLGGLDGSFCATVLIAQHRLEDVVPSGLADILAASTYLKVCEAGDEQEIEPGMALLAPAGYHLLVEQGHVRLSTEGRVSYSRPSADLLFESAADAYGPRVMAIVLTGANDDGAAGVRAVKAAGGFVVAQEPSEAERPEMPQAAIDTGSVDRVLTLDRIPGLLSVACGMAPDPQQRQSGRA